MAVWICVAVLFSMAACNLVDGVPKFQSNILCSSPEYPVEDILPDIPTYQTS